MTITHHLDDATLMSYAAGSLPGPLALVAAAHIEMCAHCRAELGHHERIGAAMLDALSPVALQGPAPAAPPRPAPQRTASRPAMGDVPSSLARLVPDLDQVRWRWVAPGVWHRPLPMAGKGTLQLIRGAPGASVPEHGHGGSELTLVLRGALIDSTGRYAAGDVADLDDGVEHMPAADAEQGCICVIANDAPTRFRGLLARLLQPWHGL
jgi:putative transcriptional regulator